MAIPRGILVLCQKSNYQSLGKCRWPLVPITTSFFNPSHVIQTRCYKGSNRYKKKKARREQQKLEKELEAKYGIVSRQEFDISAWFKSNFFKELKAFQERLGIVFNDERLLVSAFMHPSFASELDRQSEKDDNDDIEKDRQNRLQILSKTSSLSGDKLSLLGYNICIRNIKDGLYTRYPNITPGICADIISYLTSRENISMIAKNLAIDELILMSKELEDIDINEQLHLDFTIEDMICDTFFSVVGAIGKDLGDEESDSFVRDFLLTLINYEDLAKHVHLEDAHNELMKILSMHGINGVTRARTIAETGVDTHFPFFYVAIYCNGNEIARGSGYSARTARLDAFKNSVFSCLENEIDLQALRCSKKLL